MAEEEHDIPYKAEYAKSNRSSCKACKNTISKESLRIARMVQAPNFDGKVSSYCTFFVDPYVKCAFGFSHHSLCVQCTFRIS